MIRSILYMGLFAICFEAVQVRGQDVETVRAETIKSLTNLSSITCVKLSGVVSTAELESAFTIEIQQESVWISRKSRFGSTPAQKAANDKVAEETFNLLGTDGTYVEVYHDGKRYNFDPANLHLTIAKGGSVRTATYVQSLFPSNWYGFHHYQHEILRFPKLLQDLSTKGEVVGPTKVKFTNTEQVEGFKLREITVDTGHGFTTSHYEMSGGVLGKLTGDYQWAKDENSNFWYPVQGKQMTNGKVFSEWKIEKITFDASEIRSSFAFDENLFPFGTLIRDTSETENEQRRYIGGDAGKKEYELRQAADKNIRIKGMP